MLLDPLTDTSLLGAVKMTTNLRLIIIFNIIITVIIITVIISF